MDMLPYSIEREHKAWSKVQVVAACSTFLECPSTCFRDRLDLMKTYKDTIPLFLMTYQWLLHNS